MWFQLTLFFFPLFLHSFFFPNREKCSTKRAAFFHLVFSSLTRVPAPVRVQAGGASTGSPSRAQVGAGRGAWGRSRAGTWLQPPRAHPESPRPARQRSVGCSVLRPAATGARRLLSGEEPRPGIGMTSLSCWG